MKDVLKKKKKLLRIIVLIVIIIVTDYFSSKIFIPEKSSYNDFRTEHSYYHHSLLPNQSCVTNINIQNRRYVNLLDIPYIESKDYLVKTNSLGFIDRANKVISLTTEKNRVVLLGGSFVEGYGCAFENTFAGILGDKYNSNKVEILNAGVVAYSPKLMYLKTKYLLEIVNLKFSELIVFTNTIEVSDEIIYESFTPTVDKRDTKNSMFSKIKKRIRNNSFLYYCLAEIYNGRNFLEDSSAEPASTVPLMEEVWPTKENYIAERIFWQDSVNFNKWGKKGLSLAKENINALFDLCQLHNIKVTVVSHPVMEEIYENRTECLFMGYWEEMCAKYDAKYINLYPLFMQREQSADEIVTQYYIEGDGHWNEAGHRLVSDFLIHENILN